MHLCVPNFLGHARYLAHPGREAPQDRFLPSLPAAKKQAQDPVAAILAGPLACFCVDDYGCVGVCQMVVGLTVMRVTHVMQAEGSRQLGWVQLLS